MANLGEVGPSCLRPADAAPSRQSQTRSHRGRRSSNVRFELDEFVAPDSSDPHPENDDSERGSAGGSSAGDELRQTDVDDYLREIISGADPDGARALVAAASTLSADDEDLFLHEPSAEPEVLHLQFRHAQATQNAPFMHKLLTFERLMLRQAGASPHLEIAPMDKARALALAMLSGHKEMYRALSQFTTVRDADAWFSTAHPRTRCNCQAHRGSLLIRLVRGSHYHMIRAALKGGLDPNSAICDGATQRMLWREPPQQDFLREPLKLESRFEKMTPLMSAAGVQDARIVDALLEFGADPAHNGFAAFGVAARFGNVPFLERMLSEFSASMEAPDDAHARKLQQACIVALKEASANGQERVIDWVLERLQQTLAWDDADAAAAVAKRAPLRRATFTSVSAAASSLQAAGASARRKGSLLLRKGRAGLAFGSEGSTTTGIWRRSTPATAQPPAAHSEPALSEAVTSEAGSRSAGGSGRERRSARKLARSSAKAATPGAHEGLSPMARRTVSKALNSALEELVQEAGEPGASQRDAFAVAIATITGLQKSLLAEFAPQQLLLFYMQATSEEDHQPGHEAIATLLECGLGDYLAGDGKPGSAGPLASRPGRKGMTLYPGAAVPGGVLSTSGTASAHAAKADAPAQTSTLRPHSSSGSGSSLGSDFAGSSRVPRTRPPSTSSVHSVLGLGSTSGGEAAEKASPLSAPRLDTSLPELGAAALQRMRLLSLSAARSVATAWAASAPAQLLRDGLPGRSSSSGSSTNAGPVRRGSAPTALAKGARASDKERHSALFSAVQRGHEAMVRLLLGVCNDLMVERLLMDAAKFRQQQVVLLLLSELQDRGKAAAARRAAKAGSGGTGRAMSLRRGLFPGGKKAGAVAETPEVARAESDGEEEEEEEEEPCMVSNVVLCDAVVSALTVGDLDMAELLLDKGARPTPADLSRALAAVAENPDRAAHGSVQFIYDFAAVGVPLAPEQIGEVVFRGLNADTPNFPALRLVMLYAPTRFVTMKVLRRLLHRSRGQSALDSWRVMADLCLRNLEVVVADEPEEDRARAAEERGKMLSALLVEAESIADVHVGMLTLLMHACDVHPEDDHEDDDAPSRWL